MRGSCDGRSESFGPKRCAGKVKAMVSRIRSIGKVQTNETVRAEMQTFLAALASYPDRFAANPRISFEQHWGSLMMPRCNASAEAPQTRAD